MKSIKFTFLGKAVMLAFLSFGLVNCDKDKVEEEVVPDFSTTFKGVTLKPVTVAKPAATTYVAGSITTPPAVAATATALAAGTISADLSAAASKVPSPIANAIAPLLTPDVLADIKAGKALPTALAGRISDLIKSGAVNAFLSTITLPKLNDKPVGSRFAAPGSTNTVKAEQEMYSTMNACNDAVKKAFDDTKKTLDDARTAGLAQILAAYDQNIKAAVVTAEKAAALKKRNDTFASNLAFFNQALTGLASALNKKTITPVQNALFTAILVSILKDADDKADALYDNELRGLNEKATDIIEKAQRARDKSADDVKSDYEAKLFGITTIFKTENEKCHNQGGGN
jgi:hypothetical protein